MADGNRIYPVNRLVIHHSTGPEFVGASEQQVADWFNSIGQSRGYAGVAHSFHQDPRTGQETFAQAHFALHEDPSEPKYGWRLVELIAQPFDNVAWGAGDWKINQQCINIETCGDYSNKSLPEKALMLLADFWRPHDQELKGETYVNGHKEVSDNPTACPGQIIWQIPQIVQMINAPDLWNQNLWPTPAPAPEPTPEPIPGPLPVTEIPAQLPQGEVTNMTDKTSIKVLPWLLGATILAFFIQNFDPGFLSSLPFWGKIPATVQGLLTFLISNYGLVVLKDVYALVKTKGGE